MNSFAMRCSEHSKARRKLTWELTRDIAMSKGLSMNLGVYIPDQLNARLQRLREKGIDLNASNVARRALEAAVEAEEEVLAGDRIARVVTRLRAQCSELVA
jgi:predicted transcriptional regulator